MKLILTFLCLICGFMSSTPGVAIIWGITAGIWFTRFLLDV